MELEDKKKVNIAVYQLFYSFPIILHGPMMKDTSNKIFYTIHCFYMDLKHLKSTNLVAQYTPQLPKT